MSKEKQNEKVSKQRQEYLKFKPFADDLRKAESWCELDGVLNRYQTVKNLSKMGYRKQSEGEWIVDAWDNEKEEWVTIPYNKHLHADAYCSLCKAPALLDGAEYGVASNFCPNCGAKMKGGSENV